MCSPTVTTQHSCVLQTPPLRTVTPETSWSIRAGRGQPAGGKEKLLSAPWKQIFVLYSCLKLELGLKNERWTAKRKQQGVAFAHQSYFCVEPAEKTSFAVASPFNS